MLFSVLVVFLCFGWVAMLDIGFWILWGFRMFVEVQSFRILSFVDVVLTC